MKKNYLKLTSLGLLLGILIACGGTDAIPEVVEEFIEEKLEQAEIEEVAEEKKDDKPAIPNLTGELSVEVSVEIPPLTLTVLEGKAQFNMKDGQGWIDAIDAQPIEQGWGVKTLKVSTASAIACAIFSSFAAITYNDP